MPTAAQIIANQANAQRSTGPVTTEGKARVSRNATRLGLFSTVNFIRPEEQHLFEEFSAAYMIDLCPEGPLEQTLAREIVHAAWRLRRCALAESRAPEEADEEDLNRLQASIDRARSTAQRSLYRALAELRRVQTERVYRNIALPQGFDAETIGLASCLRIDPAAIVVKQASAADAISRMAIFERHHPAAAPARHHIPPAIDPATAGAAKQTQLPATPTALVPRNAPCPCGSGDKYKRCCGKNAPPVLGAKAA